MYETGKLVELNINDILPNRFQPRIYFNDEKLNQLAESIHKYGVIQPIVVRQVNNKYEIIAGERRYKASKLVNKATIPAVIVNLTDRESEEIALLENIQRQALTPIEEAVSYKRILDMGYITMEELAKKIGKDPSVIASKVSLLSLDDVVQEALLNGKISEGHARSLLRINSRAKQRELLNRIIMERLTVKRTDEEITKLISNMPKENVVTSPSEITYEPIPSHVSTNDSVELLFDPKENRKDDFMDIDKIMREAKDINVNDNQNNNQLNTQNPTAQMFNQNISSPVNQIVDQPVSTAASSMPVDDNKFVHYKPREEVPIVETPQPQSDVNFNRIFNPTINDLNVQPTPVPITPSVDEVTPTPMPSVEPTPIVQPVQTSVMPSVDTPSVNPSPEVTNVSPLNSGFPEFNQMSSIPNQTLNVEENKVTEYPSNANVSTPNSIASAVSAAFAAKENPQVEPTPFFDNPSAPVQPSVEPTINSYQAPQEQNLFNIPKEDILEDSETLGSPVQPSSISTPTKEVNLPNNNFSEVIHLIRECANKIEALGYSINVDEADLNEKYQVTFNINK